MKSLNDFLEVTLPASIFAILFIVVQWIFTLKSNGFLKTEEEWYSFGAFVMEVVPSLIAFIIIIHLIIFCVCYPIEYFLRKKNENRT
jgi:TRAP-type C4-dicarboxylate transport system permease large subunit